MAGFWGLAPITPGGNEIANGHHHDEAASGLEANNGTDTFYFPPNFGNTVITQFNVQTDVIDLPKSEFPNLAALFADAHQVGANTVISYDAHDSITLNNVALTDLHAQNFHLV